VIASAFRFQGAASAVRKQASSCLFAHRHSAAHQLHHTSHKSPLSLRLYLHPSTLSQSLFSVCPRLPPSNKSSRLTPSLPIPPLTNSQNLFQYRGNMFVDENGVLRHAGLKFGTKHVIRCPHSNVETMAARTREFYKAVGDGIPGF